MDDGISLSIKHDTILKKNSNYYELLIILCIVLYKLYIYAAFRRHFTRMRCLRLTNKEHTKFYIQNNLLTLL